MNKDEALKHHAEKYGISLNQFKTMCNNASKHYENQGMNSVDYGLAREAYFFGFADACKEALEQPLTRDWKETIDERIARDSEFKEALEQSEIGDAEIRQMLNDIEYYQKRVEALEQPSNMVTVPADKLEKMQKELKELREQSKKWQGFARRAS